MNKELMVKAGFDPVIPDTILEEGWKMLIQFFGSEESVIAKLEEVIKSEKK